MAADQTSAASDLQGADESARRRRNRLVLGIVAAPIGVLVALVLEFTVQISYAWRGVNDGGGAAAPQIIAIVVGLLATVPALIAGIRALRDRAWVGVAWGTTTVCGVGLLAVALLVVVPAFDVLPRAARDERAYREQQRLDELDDVDSGYGPGSAKEAGEAMQRYVGEALEEVGVSPSQVPTRKWFTNSTTEVGNACQQFNERVTLGSQVARKDAGSTLRGLWATKGGPTGFIERPNSIELDVYAADSTITWLRTDNVLLVVSECIPTAAS